MSNDEKFCPLCNMICKGEECAWWHYGECGLLTQARKTEDAANELYHIRRALEGHQ